MNMSGEDANSIWDSIPSEKRFEIDAAIWEGNKVGAVKQCVTFGKGFTLVSAKTFVEKRASEFSKQPVSNR